MHSFGPKRFEKIPSGWPLLALGGVFSFSVRFRTMGRALGPLHPETPRLEDPREQCANPLL